MLDRPHLPDNANGLASARAAACTLDVRGLTLEIKGERLVDGIDLSLPSDALTVIMGPNGAGKSLLLRLLHGLIAPSAGSIAWGGLPLDAAVRARQAMVFQRAVLLRRSVAANIEFVLKLKRGAGGTRRDALLRHVGLFEKRHQPARLLSGGEQQRLALARALATDPDMLFLDEPTANLDPASVALIEDTVVDAHRRGTKVIFVTHDIGQARRLADEIVFMHRGRVVEHAAADRFLCDPDSEAAQAYLDGRIVL
ncbi:MAG: ATP-binding cassette domain-containing protein [Pseudomonadota bacterium]